MQFSYSMYYNEAFVEPVSITFFTLSLFISITVPFVKKLISQDVKELDVLTIVMCVCVSISFLSMNIGRLLHGGMYLISEKETDAVKIQGQIVSIEGLDMFSFPQCKTEYGYTQLRAGNGTANGVRFTIDGVQCQASTEGVFQVGDNVTVEYLPQSRFILSIHHNGNDITPAVSQNTVDESPIIPGWLFWVIVFLLLAGILRYIAWSQHQRGLRDKNGI